MSASRTTSSVLPESRDVRGIPYDCPLSPRELQVIQLAATGMTYKRIAVELGLAHTTIRTHVHKALRRLDAPNQAQAVIMCWQRGWLDEEPSHDPELTPAAHAYIDAWLADLRNPTPATFLQRRRALGVLLKREPPAGVASSPLDRVNAT